MAPYIVTGRDYNFSTPSEFIRLIVRLANARADVIWLQQNKPLQTGFTKGMERLLGATEAAKRTEQDANELLETDHTGKSVRPDSHDRYDVEAADLQDEVEGNNRARQRYQRLFWESVAEGAVRGFEQFPPMVVEDYSRNRSCPMFLRPNAVLP